MHEIEILFYSLKDKTSLSDHRPSNSSKGIINSQYVKGDLANTI